jgi:hypothetical protein
LDNFFDVGQETRRKAAIVYFSGLFVSLAITRENFITNPLYMVLQRLITSKYSAEHGDASDSLRHSNPDNSDVEAMTLSKESKEQLSDSKKSMQNRFTNFKK